MTTACSGKQHRRTGNVSDLGRGTENGADLSDVVFHPQPYNG